MKSYVAHEARAREKAIRWTPSRLARISSLARAAITAVASVSAGPPWGGLYLKPPSLGGLCEGVTTMPSAAPPLPPAVVEPAPPPFELRRDRFARRIAWDTAGVGV